MGQQWLCVNTNHGARLAVLVGCNAYPFFVWDASQVLLVSSSRHPDKWIVPGGGMEPEEDSSVAAAREVCEEVGSLTVFHSSNTLNQAYNMVPLRFFFLIQLPC